MENMPRKHYNKMLSIISRTVSTLRSGTAYTDLRALSEEAISESSIFQSPDSIRISVIIYAAFKILIRKPDNSFARRTALLLQRAHESLSSNDLKAYRKHTAKAIDLIARQDARVKIFLEEVLEQAGIKKSSKLYDQGISLGRSARLLGVTLFDIMQYVGATSVSEHSGSIKERLKHTRRLFE